MKKILLVFFSLITIATFAQKVVITGTAFTLQHGELTFYLDKDTNSYVSIQTISYDEILKLTGIRSDKWHKEPPRGPYSKEAYLHTGYDLGHLTPSNITSHNDSLNYTSFSLFNQAPQLAAFNRGKWAQLEGKVEDMIKGKKANATILTGVLYNNNKKEFLGTSRIKIPIVYYKILVFDEKTIYVWIGSNINGLITEADIKTVLDMAVSNGDKLVIKVTK
jgi:hypothetical protein